MHYNTCPLSGSEFATCMFTLTPTAAHYWNLIGSQRRQLPKVIVASLAVTLVDTISVVMIGPFIVAILSPNVFESNASYLYVLAKLGLMGVDPTTTMSAVLILAFILKFLISAIALSKIYDFCAGVDKQIRDRLLDRFYSMRLSDLVDANSSKFIQAVHGYSGQFAYGLVALQLRLVTELTIGLILLTYLFLLYPLGLGALLTLAVIIIISYYSLFKRRIDKYGKKTAEAGEILTRAVHGIVHGIREIRIYGIENRLLSHAKTAAFSFATASARYQWIGSLPKYIIELFLFGGVAGAVILMQHIAVSHEDKHILMAIFSVGVVRLAPITNTIINGLIQMRFNGFVIDRLYYLINSNQTFVLPTEAPNFEGRFTNIKVIELAGVDFCHSPNNELLLQNVSLVIREGESIGIVGPSGSGKTTLGELILGFWEPSNGQVKINGLPRSQFSLNDLRQNFAYIPQTVFMLDGSIAENISMMDLSPPEEVRRRVVNAARMANLDRYIDTLPEGIDTLCGENGSRLSGGQRQRIALARAFYHNRSILVLDEATSALDLDTEREIIEQIRSLKGKVTMIVIAHRLETVADCDRWWRVDGGRVVEIDRSALALRP